MNDEKELDRLLKIIVAAVYPNDAAKYYKRNKQKWAVSREKNIDKIRARDRIRNKDNSRRLLTKLWHIANPESVRANAKIERDHLKFECLQHYGGECACCGEDRTAFLTLDHIGGNGAVERKEQNHRGGTEQYRILRKTGYPEGYRVLCWNCNLAFAQNGFCPHQKD